MEETQNTMSFSEFVGWGAYKELNTLNFDGFLQTGIAISAMYALSGGSYDPIRAVPVERRASEQTGEEQLALMQGFYQQADTKQRRRS